MKALAVWAVATVGYLTALVLKKRGALGRGWGEPVAIPAAGRIAGRHLFLIFEV